MIKFSAIKKCFKHEIDIQYANDLIRKCYLILVIITCDYEKQAMIISISNNKHYFIYIVSFTERERLYFVILYFK